MVLLTGEKEVGVSDGEKRFGRPGTFMLFEDTKGKGHTSRAIGSTDATAVIVRLPEERKVD